MTLFVRCRICGRPLTAAASVLRELGPICEKRLRRETQQIKADIDARTKKGL